MHTCLRVNGLSWTTHRRNPAIPLQQMQHPCANIAENTATKAAGYLSILRLVRVAAPVRAHDEVGQPLVCHSVHGVLDHAQAVEPAQASCLVIRGGATYGMPFGISNSGEQGTYVLDRFAASMHCICRAGDNNDQVSLLP